MAKYYTKYRGIWKVVKGAIYYGQYDTEEIAKEVVKKFQEYGWKRENIPKIREELGLGPTIMNLDYYPKNYSYIEGRGYYIFKQIDGEIIRIGTYEDEEIAKEIVMKLHIYGWSKDNLPRIHAELGIIK